MEDEPEGQEQQKDTSSQHQKDKVPQQDAQGDLADVAGEEKPQRVTDSESQETDGNQKGEEVHNQYLPRLG
jgi:hypothetical protein